MIPPRDEKGRFIKQPKPPPEPEPAPDPAADAAGLVDQLRVAMLKRMILMATQLPGGYYTEIKGQLTDVGGGLVGTFKLRDFAASLKDLAAIGGGKGAGTEVEDWGPLAALLGDDDEEEE